MNDPVRLSGPPFSTGGVLMRSNDGRVDDAAVLVHLDLERPEYLLPMAQPRPVAKAVVNGLPWPEALWKVAPCDACAGAVDDRIYKRAIAESGCRTSLLARKNRSHSLPLLISQRMPVHALDGSHRGLKPQRTSGRLPGRSRN